MQEQSKLTNPITCYMQDLKKEELRRLLDRRHKIIQGHNKTRTKQTQNDKSTRHDIIGGRAT